MTSLSQARATGFALRDPLPWLVFAGLVKRGEELGYTAVFLPEVAGRDALATLTGLASETTELLLGSGIVPMASRTPQLTAMAAATVQERSGGRAVLGLGIGQAVPGALDRLRELVEALRQLLSGEGVKIDGRRVRLSLVPDRPVPIWISALGPKAVRLAGEIADGVLLNWCTPERVAEAREQVGEAATAADRDPSAVTIAVYVRASVGTSAAARIALEAAAREYASYPAYRRQFIAMGLDPSDPAGLVDAVCLAGDASVARGRLDAFRTAGADLPIVYPVILQGLEPSRSMAETLVAMAVDESVADPAS